MAENEKNKKEDINKEITSEDKKVEKVEDAESKSIATSEKKEKEKLIIHRNIFIDMWAFLGMHATNINVLQKLKTAEDRQFTPGMDINGKISEIPIGDDIGKKDKEEIAIMAIRSKVWDPPKEDLEKTLERVKKKKKEFIKKGIKKRGGRLNKEQKEELDEKLEEKEINKLTTTSIDKRRLIIKMFSSTGKRIHWKGTIEEITTKELHNSLASNHPLVYFTIVLSGYDYVTVVQQNLRYFALAPVYSFNYWDEKLDKMWYFTIFQRFISIGIDFDVYAEGRKIAFLDGKLVGLGGNSNVKIYDEFLAKDKKFADILVLFTSTVGYQRVMRKYIKKRMKSIIKSGKIEHIIEDEEFWMMKNPRRLIR